jgi:ribosomal protein L24E
MAEYRQCKGCPKRFVVVKRPGQPSQFCSSKCRETYFNGKRPRKGDLDWVPNKRSYPDG